MYQRGRRRTDAPVSDTPVSWAYLPWPPRQYAARNRMPGLLNIISRTYEVYEVRVPRPPALKRMGEAFYEPPK